MKCERITFLSFLQFRASEPLIPPQYLFKSLPMVPLEAFFYSENTNIWLSPGFAIIHILVLSKMYQAMILILEIY